MDSSVQDGSGRAGGAGPSGAATPRLGGWRARFRWPVRRFCSSRRSLAAFVGLVDRRLRGTARPAASLSRNRSSASSRFRAWPRASWATAVTCLPWRAARRALLLVGERRRRGDLEHRLHPRGGHVGVLASGPRGAAGADLDLGERNGNLGVDRHRIVHALTVSSPKRAVVPLSFPPHPDGKDWFGNRREELRHRGHRPGGGGAATDRMGRPADARAANDPRALREGAAAGRDHDWAAACT